MSEAPESEVKRLLNAMGKVYCPECGAMEGDRIKDFNPRITSNDPEHPWWDCPCQLFKVPKFDADGYGTLVLLISPEDSWFR